MTIDSVDKLRARIYDSTLSNQTREDMECIADEIESEIERDYMRLPVDVNNEPVHIGDEMEHRSKHETLDVIAVGNDSFFTGRWADNYVRCVEVSAQWHHVKPDPLKKLLVELTNEVWGASCTCQTTWSDSGLDGIEERYADRIRELLEVGE